MTDTVSVSPLRAARERLGYSREQVSRQLEPPISTKTLERWEVKGTDKHWRLVQLASLYNVAPEELAAAVA